MTPTLVRSEMTTEAGGKEKRPRRWSPPGLRRCGSAPERSSASERDLPLHRSVNSAPSDPLWSACSALPCSAHAMTPRAAWSRTGTTPRVTGCQVARCQARQQLAAVDLDPVARFAGIHPLPSLAQRTPNAIHATRTIVRTFVEVRRDAWERGTLQAARRSLGQAASRCRKCDGRALLYPFWTAGVAVRIPRGRSVGESCAHLSTSEQHHHKTDKRLSPRPALVHGRHTARALTRRGQGFFLQQQL